MSDTPTPKKKLRSAEWFGTADKNERAQRLFAKLGFRRTMVEMTREL